METNKNETQIIEILENWAKAVREKDIEGVLASHSTNILLFDVPEPLQSKGINDYRQSWEKLFFPWYGKNGQFDLTELDVTAGEEVAFCHGIINCQGTENGKKISLKVRLTVGLKKTNGKWLIEHEHHSETSK